MVLIRVLSQGQGTIWYCAWLGAVNAGAASAACAVGSGTADIL